MGYPAAKTASSHIHSSWYSALTPGCDGRTDRVIAIANTALSTATCCKNIDSSSKSNLPRCRRVFLPASNRSHLNTFDNWATSDTQRRQSAWNSVGTKGRIPKAWRGRGVACGRRYTRHRGRGLGRPSPSPENFFTWNGVSGIFCPCLREKNVEFSAWSDGLVPIGERWRCTLGSSEYAYAVKSYGVGKQSDPWDFETWQNLGTVCISVPHSKFWGTSPMSPVIYGHADTNND